ncbi:Type II and III secretion system protein precursor (fragment) [Xenorhabdus bovienii SS-2004]|uniref:Type II and III secretion system protein n=1 Tax=Xenorhabdus bovienii (strain SS-2004) TaxID=406818 RepID=D3V5D4_XENBS
MPSYSVMRYKYFLNIDVVITTTIPSKSAAGSNTIVGYTTSGHDKYSTQALGRVP